MTEAEPTESHAPYVSCGSRGSREQGRGLLNPWLLLSSGVRPGSSGGGSACAKSYSHQAEHPVLQEGQDGCQWLSVYLSPVALSLPFLILFPSLLFLFPPEKQRQQARSETS